MRKNGYFIRAKKGVEKMVELDIMGDMTGIIMVQEAICGHCFSKLICDQNKFVCPECARKFVQVKTLVEI